MVKWFLILALVAFIASAYLFTSPSQQSTAQTLCKANQKAFTRALTDLNNWYKWWPGEIEKGADGKPLFHYNNRRFTVVEKRFSSLVVDVNDGHSTTASELLFLPLVEDSLRLVWQATGAPTTSVYKRLKRLFTGNSLQADMNEILQKLKAFHETESNLYGVKIEKTFVQDSNLIATAVYEAQPPSVQTVYGLVDRLQAFAAAKGARQTNPPMLNVSPAEGGKIRVQVALPVDRKLPNEGTIGYRWMLGGGNILATEVRGGPAAITNAFSQLENYVNDYRRIAPAIPFESLVTDRRQEPDTGKWVTRVYWPVM